MAVLGDHGPGTPRLGPSDRDLASGLHSVLEGLVTANLHPGLRIDINLKNDAIRVDVTLESTPKVRCDHHTHGLQLRLHSGGVRLPLGEGWNGSLPKRSSSVSCRHINFVVDDIHFLVGVGGPEREEEIGVHQRAGIVRLQAPAPSALVLDVQRDHLDVFHCPCGFVNGSQDQPDDECCKSKKDQCCEKQGAYTSQAALQGVLPVMVVVMLLLEHREVFVVIFAHVDRLAKQSTVNLRCLRSAASCNVPKRS